MRVVCISLHSPLIQSLFHVDLEAGFSLQQFMPLSQLGPDTGTVAVLHPSGLGRVGDLVSARQAQQNPGCSPVLEMGQGHVFDGLALLPFPMDLKPA